MCCVKSVQWEMYQLMHALYVQVTVHRDMLRINNQQDAPIMRNFILSRNSTCFGHLLCPSSGITSCTCGNWYVSCRLCGRCLGEWGWCAHHQELSAVHVAIGMFHAGYVAATTCTTDSSWWWAQMPETCRVSWQNKILDTWCILLVIYTKDLN